MMYCPKCGLEQRCGCEECHRCGARLQRKTEGEPRAFPVEGDATSRKSGRHTSIEEAVRTSAPQAPLQFYTPGKFRHSILFVVFLAGVCLILLSIIETLSRADTLIRTNYGIAVLSSGKNVGYFLGGLIYGTSLRLVIGFVFLLLGLFSNPPLPFSNSSKWEKCVFSICAAMLLLFLAGLISVILIMIPGRQSLILRNFIPPTILSIPAILLFSFFMLVTAFLVGYWVIASRGDHEESNSLVQMG